MIVPVLIREDKIQINDQTRFDATKSFVTKGSDSIKALFITAGADGAPVNVYEAQSKNWFLDWIWGDFKIDINTTNNKLWLMYSNTKYSVTLDTDTYDLTELCAEILAKLSAGIAAVAWTVGISLDNKITITADKNIETLPKEPGANLWPVIGFSTKCSGKNLEGSIIENLPRTISVKVVTTIADPGADPDPIVEVSETKTFTQLVCSVAGDCLFSTDGDLMGEEPGIMQWVAAGRASFLSAHRASQDKIMQWLDQQGHTDIYGKRLSKFALIDLEDVRHWSKYLTLASLFSGFQNSVDDVFKEKSKYYSGLALANRNQAQLNIDKITKGQAEPSASNAENTTSGLLVMR